MKSFDFEMQPILLHAHAIFAIAKDELENPIANQSETSGSPIDHLLRRVSPAVDESLS